MKTFLFLCLFFLCFFSRAANYYVNPASDSTNEKGTITNPWKSFEAVNVSMKIFKPGDTVFIKKGELYSQKLRITCSGLENAPIVFMTYGSAVSKPVLLFNPSLKQAEYDYNAITLYRCRYIVLDGFEITDDRMDKHNHSYQADVDIAINIDSSDFISIKNMDVSLVGVGVNIQGANNIVDKCRFQNLRMIKNTVGGDDDYGANPIVISGPDNTISNCFFKDCWANSYDYEFDGGAIEIFGASDNNKILNNTAINCDGFMEIGSLSEGSCTNLQVTRNTIINCGELVYISTGGKYKIMVSNLRFSGNTVIHSVNQLTKPKSMMGMQTALTMPGIINLEDNIFWLTSGIDLARPSQFLNGQMIHKNNIFYMSAGRLNFPPDSSELLINKDSPLSNKLMSLHPGLKNMDIFPFFYLLIALLRLMY